jgi:hypothetical protein
MGWATFWAISLQTQPVTLSTADPLRARVAFNHRQCDRGRILQNLFWPKTFLILKIGTNFHPKKQQIYNVS